MILDDVARAEIRSAWLSMSRLQRRRAIRALGVFAAVDVAGICPAEVVLALKGPTFSADRVVRAALATCRSFFRRPTP